MEKWQTVVDFPNYEVSNLGRLRHKKLLTIRKFRTHKGYSYIALHQNGKKRVVTVHRLVAKAFLPNYSELLQVDHVNRVRNDNRADNLQMVTSLKNLKNRGDKKYIVQRIIELHQQGFSVVEIMNRL